MAESVSQGRKLIWRWIDNQQACVPILNEDRTFFIKDHILKAYSWTGKCATRQKHKNVVKPKLNTDTDWVLFSSNKTLSLRYGSRWLLPGVLQSQLILKLLKA